MAAEALAWVAQRDAVVRRAQLGCLMGILKDGATPFIILMASVRCLLHGDESEEEVHRRV